VLTDVIQKKSIKSEGKAVILEPEDAKTMRNIGINVLSLIGVMVILIIGSLIIG
jgi:hypothetical protein